MLSTRYSCQNLDFLERLPKNTNVPTFMKMCPVGAELFHADGRTDRRTDMTKIIVAFRNFCERAFKPTVRITHNTNLTTI
jgi:hypothetical protein